MLSLSLVFKRPVLSVYRHFVFKRLYQNAHQSLKPASFPDTNTNVAKDVILFKYENPRYFKFLNIFAISQLGIWMYLASYVYNRLENYSVPEEDPENRDWGKRINLREQKYRTSITVACCSIGYLCLVGAWTFTLKSVRFLILRKGGKKISLVTYTPFGENRIMDVPIDKVRAAESWNTGRAHLPIVVKGKKLHYIMDKRGQFLNRELFDAIMSFDRRFAKS